MRIWFFDAEVARRRRGIDVAPARQAPIRRHVFKVWEHGSNAVRSVRSLRDGWAPGQKWLELNWHQTYDETIMRIKSPSQRCLQTKLFVIPYARSQKTGGEVWKCRVNSTATAASVRACRAIFSRAPWFEWFLWNVISHAEISLLPVCILPRSHFQWKISGLHKYVVQMAKNHVEVGQGTSEQSHP